MMLSGEHATWVRQVGPPLPGATPAGVPTLVCFPHAGGAASSFRALARALAPRLEAVAVQYPGRQDRRREGPVHDLLALADHLADVIEGAVSGPIGFFGHSMGATVAFETARRLERRGRVLEGGLIVSGRPGPRAARPRRVHELPTPELIAEVRRLGGTHSDLLEDPEVVEMIEPVLRADYAAVDAYRYEPGPDLSCPVLALNGDSDPMVCAESAGTWSEHTTAPFTSRVLPGGHFYLDAQVNAVQTIVADRIEALLGAR